MPGQAAVDQHDWGGKEPGISQHSIQVAYVGVVRSHERRNTERRMDGDGKINLAGLEKDVSPQEVLQGDIFTSRQRLRSPLGVEGSRSPLRHLGYPQRAKICIKE